MLCQTEGENMNLDDLADITPAELAKLQHTPPEGKSDQQARKMTGLR